MQCSSRARFGNPTASIEKANVRLAKIVNDKPYYKWLQIQARKYAAKYRVDPDDLLQTFFLAVVEKQNPDIKHSFFGTIRKEYKRGITGSYDAVDVFSTEELIKPVRDASRAMDHYEFVEYLCDLKTMLNNETEYKMVCMFLVGFDKGEIFERSKDLSRRDFKAFWERINLPGHKQIKATERK